MLRRGHLLKGAAALALAGALTACGSSGGPNSTGSKSSGSSGTASSAAGSSGTSHPTFVYLQTDGSQSYFVLEGDGAKSEASSLGARVKVENENNSSATTISDIQTAIADKVNGLIVVAPSASLGPRMVSLANGAHIPIMASDNGFAGSNGKQVPFVGINAAQFGDSTGTLLMNYYKKKGWPSASTYMLLYTNPALPTCNDRTNAEEAKVVAGGFPKSHIITVPTTDNTTQAAFSNTGPVKTSHPQAKYWLLAGCNDDVTYGGAKALTSSSVSASNVDAVGLGGDLACQIWAPGAPNVGFVATNYIFPNGIGSDAVKEMYNAVVKRQAFPANTYVTPEPMTQSNYKTIDKSC
jgi:L-arabinose transport system substrate-binding protein